MSTKVIYRIIRYKDFVKVVKELKNVGFYKKKLVCFRKPIETFIFGTLLEAKEFKKQKDKEMGYWKDLRT